MVKVVKIKKYCIPKGKQLIMNTFHMCRKEVGVVEVV